MARRAHEEQEVSELDLILDPDWMANGARRGDFQAARAELAALRERVADLEMMLRAVFGPSENLRSKRFQPRQVHAIEFLEGDGSRWLEFAFHSGVGDCRVPIDSTGLPALTPEARAALRETEKR